MKILRNQKGISLIEIVFSLALIGFIILVIGNVPNSIRLIGRTQKEALAKDIASKEIEQLRLLTYTNLSNGTISISDARLVNLPQSSATAVVSDCPVSICSNNEATKQVAITITWYDQSSIQKVTMGTLISSGGLK